MVAAFFDVHVHDRSARDRTAASVEKTTKTQYEDHYAHNALPPNNDLFFVWWAWGIAIDLLLEL